jgi:hypothetical protein
MSNLKDILNANNGKLPDDILLAYMEGKLPAAEQHEIEKWLADTGMESDALEGLQQLPAADTKAIVDRLNYNLGKELSKNKKRRTKAIKSTPWGWAAIVIILMLCIAAYLVLYFATKD